MSQGQVKFRDSHLPFLDHTSKLGIVVQKNYGGSLVHWESCRSAHGLSPAAGVMDNHLPCLHAQQRALTAPVFGIQIPQEFMLPSRSRSCHLRALHMKSTSPCHIRKHLSASFSISGGIQSHFSHLAISPQFVVPCLTWTVLFLILLKPDFFKKYKFIYLF